MFRKQFAPHLVARTVAFLFLAVAASVFAGNSAAATHHIFQWRPFLAPFHSVVLHLPIGFVAIAFILEIYAVRRPSQEIRRVTRLVLFLSLLSGAVTAGLGILRAETGGYEHHAVEVHRNFGISVPLLIAIALLLQKTASRTNASPAWLFGYRAVLGGTLAVVMIAGHLGGNLTHGSRYLVENAPQFVRELVDEVPPAQDASGSDEQQRFYAEKVRPILAAKCLNCHSSEKQKGGYRLDKPELALKGGKSGKIAIKAGDPAESELVRRILLPRDHDDAMPPSGKESLTADQSMTIVNWIRDGAAIPSDQPPTPLVGTFSP